MLWAVRWTSAASDAANVGSIDPFGRRLHMCPRENEDVLEAMRAGIAAGRKMREALEAGKVSEATVAAACSASPGKPGKFRAVPSGFAKH